MAKAAMNELVICEKPNVARKIAQALSGLGSMEQKRHKQVTYFIISTGTKKIYIAPAVGHIYGLKSETKNLQYPVFDIYWAPSYEVDKKNQAYTKDYLDVFLKISKDIDSCIVACDYDIEGSLIGYNVLRFACKKEDGKRMKFSTLTEEELLEAYNHLQPMDKNNAIAGETRHVLDWYYGINLSRALMNAIKTAKGWHKIFSIGRVQGPTLSLLVELEKRINAFIPTPYWVLTAMLKDTRFTHEKEKIEDQDLAEKLHREIKGKDATITKVDKKEYKQYPFPPFDLTSLQTEAYKAFGFNPSYTLQVAQGLYEKSYISYPRTSSQKLPPGLNFKGIMARLAKITAYSELVKKATNKRPIEGKKEDPAHPAIHPTGYHGEMNKQEQKLYDLIVKRFLACFADPALRESTRVDAEIAGNKFNASGTRTLKKEWLEIYTYAKFDETEIDHFDEQEIVKAKNDKLDKKMTKPPNRFTQASLVSELEKRKLGTKATRANVIDTLTARGYIHGRSIQMTTLGMNVHASLMKFSEKILDEELTRDIEEKMEGIQFDKVENKKVMEEGRHVLFEMLNEFKKHEKEIGEMLALGIVESDKERNTLGKCNKCGEGDLRIIFSASRKQFVGCTKYPDCSNTFSLPQNSLIQAVGKTCEHCKTPIIKVIRKGRKPFDMCLEYNCKSKEGWGKKSSKESEKKESNEKKS